MVCMPARTRVLDHGSLELRKCPSDLEQQLAHRYRGVDILPIEVEVDA